jgi:formylglycine-generating enzyme required for sulfatase activity
MKFQRLLFILVIILVFIAGCDKDDSTSTKKTPYYESALQIAPIAVKGQDVVASITVIDPKGKQVSAKFDWGDGSPIVYTDLFDSGEAIFAHHTYTQAGTYNVKAYAKNEANTESGAWSVAKQIQILNAGVPYVQDITVSKIELLAGHEVTVSALAEEMAGFQVQARVDWGDSNISQWSEMSIATSVHTFDHIYNLAGSYQVKVQARSSIDSLSTWYNASALVKVHNAPPANDLVLIPAGTFTMGSVDPTSLANEAPLNVKDVSAFYMSKFEISQAEWQAVMNNNPASFANNGEIHAAVENVDWYDCIEYCNRRSVIDGLEPVYSILVNAVAVTDPAQWPANWNAAYPDTSAFQIACDFNATGYRLPTEVEWEYAAKAGTANIYSGTSDPVALMNYAWFGSAPYQTHIVGLKLPNAWGLYDMSGNVWEWCWDNYRFYTGNTANMTTANKSLRITRGGAFNSRSSILRVSYRNPVKPSLKGNIVGLRVVKKA